MKDSLIQKIIAAWERRQQHRQRKDNGNSHLTHEPRNGDDAWKRRQMKDSLIQKITVAGGQQDFKPVPLPDSIRALATDVVMACGKFCFALDVIVVPTHKSSSKILQGKLVSLENYLMSRGFHVCTSLASELDLGDGWHKAKLHVYSTVPEEIIKKMRQEHGNVLRQLREQINELARLSTTSAWRECLPVLQSLSQRAELLSEAQQNRVVGSLSPCNDWEVQEELCYFMGRTGNLEFAECIRAFHDNSDLRVQERAKKAILEMLKSAMGRLYVHGLEESQLGHCSFEDVCGLVGTLHRLLRMGLKLPERR